MKGIKYTLSLSLLTIMLGACSDDLNTEYGNDDLAVRFSAKVAKMITRSASSETLADGTIVNISNDGYAYYSYTSDSNGDLTPTTGSFVRWSSTSQSSMNIKAYTPDVDGATAEYFSLKDLTDQSKSENLAKADFASFDGTVNRGKDKSNVVSFELQRRMTQVKLTITKIDDTYKNTTDDTYTFDVSVYSPSTSIEVSDDEVTGDGNGCEIKTNGGTGIAKDATATAIITPGDKDDTKAFIAVQVKKNGAAEGSKLIATGCPELKAGSSYSFELEVHKDAIAISSMQVTDWDTVDNFKGGEAGYNISLDSYSTAKDVYAAIKSLSDKSITAISLTGKIQKYIDASKTTFDVEMDEDEKTTLNGFTALRDFIFDSETETWLPIESIDLSDITDLTEIPFMCFYYFRQGTEDGEGDVIETPNTYLKEIKATQVKTIGYGAFAYCTSLTSVNIPSVTTVSECAFIGCDSLESVSLPLATTINSAAFIGCQSLKSISLPEVTTIGEQAFNECESLESVSLTKVTSIGRSSFKGCKSLTSIELPIVETIGNVAFGYCSSLTSINLPAATSIGKCAFRECTSLNSVSIPKATDFGEDVFEDCTTTNIDITLNSSQKSNVSGTTWTYKWTENSYDEYGPKL